MTTVHTQLKKVVSTPWRRPKPVPTTQRPQRTECLNGGSHHWDIATEPSHIESGWVFLSACRVCGEKTTFPYKYTPGNGPAEESAVKRLREPTYEELVRAVIRGAEIL